MSETDRLGGKRLSRLMLFGTALAVLLISLLGATVLLLWPHRPPPSRYAARLVAMQWVQEPKTEGSLLALCVRVTRRDGGLLIPGDFDVSLPGAEGQGLELSSAIPRYLPNLQSPKIVEVIFFYRKIGKQPLVAALDGELHERVPPTALESFLARMGRPMETFFKEPVEGMPAAIPPTSPRASQTDLSNFIMGRHRQTP